LPSSHGGAIPHYRELSFYTGQSFGYPQVLSDLPGQRLFLVGVRLTGRLHNFRNLALNGNADLKPLALYSNDLYGPRKYTYGGGGAVGLQFVPHMHWRSHPFFEVDGGVLAFTKQIPVPDSRRLNITFDFGPGFYVPLANHQAIKIGMQFFHFSNGDTVKRNPSFDTFLIYVAFTFRNFLNRPQEDRN
jgi:hypothetical protein